MVYINENTINSTAFPKHFDADFMLELKNTLG